MAHFCVYFIFGSEDYFMYSLYDLIEILSTKYKNDLIFFRDFLIENKEIDYIEFINEMIKKNLSVLRTRTYDINSMNPQSCRFIELIINKRNIILSLFSYVYEDKIIFEYKQKSLEIPFSELDETISNGRTYLRLSDGDNLLNESPKDLEYIIDFLKGGLQN